MSTITRTYSYTAGDTIDPDQNNANENALYNLVNGNIDNDNVKAGAAITESKIAFGASGHGHTGGADGKLIPKGYAVAVVGTLTTGTSVTPAMVCIAAQTITKVYASVKTAPTSASILIDINVNGTSIWNTTQANRLTITAGATYGTQTSFDTTTLAEGDILTFDIDQVGSGNPGQDVTIVLS